MFLRTFRVTGAPAKLMPLDTNGNPVHFLNNFVNTTCRLSYSAAYPGFIGFRLPNLSVPGVNEFYAEFETQESAEAFRVPLECYCDQVDGRTKIAQYMADNGITAEVTVTQI